MYHDQVVECDIAPGTPFYEIDGDGFLKTIYFVQKQILDGASVPTYTFKDIGRGRFACSVDMYHDSIEKAWDAEIAQYEEGIPECEKHIEEVQKQLEEHRSRLQNARQAKLNLQNKKAE